ncbi:hypothetical protein D046_0859A, partial [Vibrio parahaemolyticus V-223/04]
MALEIRKSDP